MVNEAEQHSEEDKKRRQEIETRNQADTLVYNTEKILNENRDKIADADVKNIESAIQACKDAINSGDTDTIKKRMEELNKASHRLAEAMYQSAQQQRQGTKADTGAGASQTTPSGGGEGEVVDAEFEESK